MPQNILLPILPGQIADPCFTTWQGMLVQFANAMKAVLPGTTFFNQGSTKPPPELQAYPWLYEPTLTFYEFVGVWRSPNPETSPLVRRLFMGTAADVWSYDQGDGTDPSTNPPGPYTGAMWEIDNLFTGRSPMGPGVVPGTTNPVITLLPPGSSPGDQIGEGQHVQAATEVGQHVHPPLTTGDNPTFLIQQDGGVSSATLSGSGTFPRDATTGKNSDGGLAGNITHPVQACWIIKRTARTYYVIS